MSAVTLEKGAGVDNNMGELKTSYELSVERTVLPVHPSVEPTSRFVSDLPRNVVGSRAVVDRMIKERSMSKKRADKDSDLEITYAGPFLSNSGFSKMNREIALRLRMRGVKVKVETAGEQVHVEESVQNVIAAMTEERTSGEEPKIFGMTIPPLLSHKGRKILYTMIESSKGVHHDYAEKVNLANEAWVPNPYLRDIMYKSGVRVPTLVMPLGVDADLFSPDGPTFSLPPSTKGFKFISSFWWGIRKGYDILLKAYLKEFTDEDDVSLIISSKAHGASAQEDIVSKIRWYVQSSGNPNPPHVMLHSEMLTDADMAALYRSCNAFVLMSRGEGFGLPIIEAAACGLPVIVSNCTAQSTYLSKSDSFLIEPDGYDKSSVTGFNNGAMAKWCKFYEDQFFPVFGDESIRELGRTMRLVYEGGGDADKKAEQLRSKIVSSMTWDHAADGVMSRLHDIRNGKKLEEEQ